MLPPILGNANVVITMMESFVLNVDHQSHSITPGHVHVGTKIMESFAQTAGIKDLKC